MEERPSCSCSRQLFGRRLSGAVVLSMKVREQSEERRVEGDVEAPAPHARAARSLMGDVKIEHERQHDEAELKLRDLALGDHPLPARAHPEGARQVVSVHQHMHRRVRDQNEWEQRLRGVQPQIAHDHHGGVVVHVKEGETLDGAAEDDQKRVDELDDL